MKSKEISSRLPWLKLGVFKCLPHSLMYNVASILRFGSRHGNVVLTGPTLSSRLKYFYNYLN